MAQDDVDLMVLLLTWLQEFLTLNDFSISLSSITGGVNMPTPLQLLYLYWYWLVKF